MSTPSTRVSIQITRSTYQTIWTRTNNDTNQENQAHDDIMVLTTQNKRIPTTKN